MHLLCPAEKTGGMDASIVFRLKSVTEGDDVTALRLVDAGRAQHGLEYLGLDVSRFRSEMDGESYRQRIREQMEAARRSHLRATPGFFVDRRIQDVTFGHQALFDATEAALSRRGRPKTRPGADAR